MENKLKKSVMATGLAATTVLSAGMSHQVQAEELGQDGLVKAVQVTQKLEEKSARPEEPKTLEAAEKALAEQTSVVETAEAEKAQAAADVEAAEKEVAESKGLLNQATPEGIEAAEKVVPEAEAAVPTAEKAVEEAEAAVTEAEKAVQEQKPVVDGQQTLVDMAQSELNEAKKPIAQEEAEVMKAKESLASAEKDLAEKEANLASVKANQADLPAKITVAEGQIKSTQTEITKTEAAIKATEAALKTAQATATNTQPLNLSTATYSQFLENLKKTGNSAVQAAASNALSTYDHGRSVYGIEVGTDSKSPATLENNLTALELVKYINAYRKRAGLNELLVDPYQNVASQIQTRYFEKANWHMGKYFGNENVAISFNPQGAVEFWHNEKTLYQQIAAQYGLPTNETQIDANAIYMKVGGSVFAQIGHYVQMMDNKANAISAAFDKEPNAYSNVWGTSEVGFHNVRNFSERVANGTLVTADQLAQMIRSFAAGSGTNAKANQLQKDLDMLKVQKTNQESKLSIQKGQLADLKAESTNQTKTLQEANAQVLTAQAVVAKAQAEVSKKEQNLENARQNYETAIAPKEAALKKAQGLLTQAQEKLAELEGVLKTKQEDLAKAKAALQASKDKVEAAKTLVENLKNAPKNLALAEAKLQAAKENYENKLVRFEQEGQTLAFYQAAYDKLLVESGVLVSQMRRGGAGAPGAGQMDPEAQVAPAAGQAAPQAMTYRSSQAAATSTNKVALAQAAKSSLLPSTGLKGNDVASLGLLLGSAALLVAKRRKEEE